MTEPLSDLTEFSQAKDYNSLVGRHSGIEDDIEGLKAELEETLGSESDLDDAQIEQIRDIYADVVQPNLQSLQNRSYDLEGFSPAVQDIQDDIEEVLHNPKAEAVVDKIDGWIVSTGLEPLSSDEKRGLREVIITDIEASSTAVTEAKSAHDALRGDLGSLQGQVDKSLRAELVATDAPSDLGEIRDSLQKLEKNWYGDWKLSYELNVGKELNEEIWTTLVEEIQTDLEDGQNLNKIAVLVSTRSERIERALSNIDEVWAKVETEYRRISDDVSYDESKLLILLENVRQRDPSLSRYLTAIKKLREGLETLCEIQREDFSEFQSERESAVEELKAPLGEVRTALEEASKIQQEDVLKTDSVQEIEELKDRFEDHLDDASDSREKLQSRLTEKVKTVRRLSQKFDIDSETDLTDLYTNTVGESSVDRLLELSDTTAAILEESRKQARKELPERQAQLLEDMLALSANSPKLTLEIIEAELGDSYGDDLLEALLGLREHDLLEINISIN